MEPTGKLVLDPDFFEFIECCVAREVRFLVVGGWALAAHGHPRATKDFDVWLWTDRDNANRMVEALSDFGFGSSGLTADDFLDPAVVVQFGRAPLQIDVIGTIDGVDFVECWPRRVEIEIGGLPVPFISEGDFIANKLASGRAQDLADVYALQEEGP
jgi:hypothetical protein